MESLGWDDSQILTNTSSMWIHQQHDTQESLIVSNSNPCVYGGKMDLVADIFNQIQEPHEAQTLQLNSNSVRVSDY